MSAAQQEETVPRQDEMVSVIIPTYNGSRFLTETVRSALQQRYSPLEVIVVDDGSTEDIASSLEPVREAIRYLRQENKGPAAARNSGIRASRGRYLAFMDHDDLWPPDKTAAQVKVMQNDPACGLVYSYPKLIDAHGHQIANEAPSCFPSGDVLIDFAVRNRITSFSATLFRRSVFDEIGYLNESSMVMTADDYEIYLRIAEKYKVLYCAEGAPYYRLHDGNMAKNYLLNYSATLAVLQQLLHRNKQRLESGVFKQLEHAVKANITRLAGKYGFLLYYANDRKSAGRLLRKAFLRKPWSVMYLSYAIVCLLPEPFLAQLKALRKH